MDEEVDYGRIALIPKGDFAGDVQYDVGDVVSYEGSSYLAKRKPPVATLPTDTEYWQIVSQGSKYIYINLTTAEYNERLTAYLADPSYIDPDTGTLFSETLYNITDDYETLARTAEGVKYTDTFMLGSTNVQGIIDIIADKVANQLLSKSDVVDNLESTVSNLPASARTVNVLNRKVSKLELNFTDKTTSDPKVIFENIYAGLPNGLTTGTLVTGTYTYDFRCFKLSNSFGDVWISSYCTFRDKKQPVYGTIFSGVWHWQKVVTEDMLDYQLIGSVTGANSVAIDSELYTEFLVKIKIPNTIVEFEVHLCSTELTTTAKRPSYGCMFASNDYYGGSINATNTSIKLDYIWRNGVSITDTTTMTVYGKR